jgi:methylated-DNA-protein-cysteine methyltransferase related protein
VAAKKDQTPEQRILEVVRAIPRGKVATYGQVAELAGIARGHRIAARTMKTAVAGVPWQRVLAKKDARRAQISIQDPDHAREQRKLLTREGVRFDANGFVVLRDYGWLDS